MIVKSLLKVCKQLKIANLRIKQYKDQILHEARLTDIDISKKISQTYNLPVQNIVVVSIVNNSCIK